MIRSEEVEDDSISGRRKRLQGQEVMMRLMEARGKTLLMRRWKR
jgi:hypothetical protein